MSESQIEGFDFTGCRVMVSCGRREVPAADRPGSMFLAVLGIDVGSSVKKDNGPSSDTSNLVDVFDIADNSDIEYVASSKI